MGAVCYADDVALLAPSPSALRLILDTCRRVANSLSLFFNAAETQLICFSSCASDTYQCTELCFSWGIVVPLQNCYTSWS